MGKAEQANKEKDGFVSRFDCDDIGEVKEYVGCKIDKDVKDNIFKFTQPVMIQSFRDEFELEYQDTSNTSRSRNSIGEGRRQG